MSYIRAKANIKFDNAHADGKLTKLGFGRERPAAQPNVGDNWTADLTEDFGWRYGNSCRYVEDLGCMTVRPRWGGNKFYSFDSGYYRRVIVKSEDENDEGANMVLTEIKTHLSQYETEQADNDGWVYDENLWSTFATNQSYIIINSGKWALSPEIRRYRDSRRFILTGKTVGDDYPFNNYKHYGEFTTSSYIKNIAIDIYAGPLVEGDTVNEAGVDVDGSGLFIEFLEEEGETNYTQIALYFPRLESDDYSGRNELFFTSLYNPTYAEDFREVIQSPVLLMKTPQDSRYKIIHAFENINIFDGGDGEADCLLMIEWIDDHLVVTVINENDTQSEAYAPTDFEFKNTLNQTCKWAEPAKRKVKISAAGSIFKIGLGEMNYDGNIRIKPTTYTKVPSDIEYTPSYYLTLDYDKNSPGLATATTVYKYNFVGVSTDYYKTDVDYNSDGNITGGKIWYNSSRPYVNISANYHSESGVHLGEDDTIRAFYSVSEYRKPTIVAGTSSIVQTQNNINMRLQRVSGDMDDSWQNHTVNFEIESFDGTLPEINPNLKTTVEISLNDGQNYSTHFTGYLSGDYEKNIETVADGNVIFSLTARDPINSRLDKKLIYWQCAFDGWDIVTAFKYILNCAGVPDSRIHIAPSIETYIENNTGLHDYIIPLSRLRREKNFLYEPDTQVRQVLDELVESVGEKNPIRWGTDTDGKYKLLRKEKYVHGTSVISFDVDEDTLTDDDIVFSFSRSRNYEDFANVFIILGGRGWSSNTKLYIDGASINDTNDSEFIGDPWYSFEWINSEKNINKVLTEKYKSVNDNIYRIYLELHNHHTLHPDDYITVNVDNVDIPNNSVYKIVNKSWSVEVDRAEYVQNLEAILVYTPSS